MSEATATLSFHTDCVDHICRLERRLERLRKMKATGPKPAKLEELKLMLCDIERFTKSHIDGAPNWNSASDVASLRTKLQKLQKLLSGRSWDAVKRMLGGIDMNAFELKSTYDELSRDFMKFIVEHFVSCVKRFDVPAPDKQAYLESVDAFTVELQRIW